MQIDFPGRKPLESSVFVSAKYSAPTTPPGFPVISATPGTSFTNPIGYYRRPIKIDNTQNSNTLSDYQVLVTLDTASLISAGKMRSDCGDIRFTDSDGATLLDYWIASGINTSNTEIWVKIPSIPGSSVKTIYLYYGNPSATSMSNGTRVFNFFEDFTEYAVGSELAGQNGWYGYSYSSATRTIIAGDKVTLPDGTVFSIIPPTNQALHINSSQYWGGAYRSFSFPFPGNGYAVRSRVYLAGHSNVEVEGFRIGFGISTATDGGGDSSNMPDGYFFEHGMVSDSILSSIRVCQSLNCRTLNYLLGIGYLGLWSECEERWYGSTLESWCDGKTISVTDTTYSSANYLYIGVYSSNCAWIIDWICIRKYNPPEPTTSVGPEQTYY